MARHRTHFGHALALALASAGTVWLATLSWRGFTASDDFLVGLALIGLAIAGVGAAARWARLPVVLVIALQLLVGLLVLAATVTGSPVPGEELRAALSAANESAQRYPSPVPEQSGVSVHPLLLGSGFLVLMLVDVLACSLRRVPLAGLPLLAVYSVPISLLAGGLDWRVFAVTALGFLLMLYLQEQHRASGWGRALEEGGTTLTAGDERRGWVRASAIGTAVVAVLAAVAVPRAIPTLELEAFQIGAGDGEGDIRIRNPMVDLRRDLRRGEDDDLIQVVTDDPEPDYLRISVLNRFSDNEWSSGDRDVPSDQVPNGAMPTLIGVLASIPRESYSYDVEATDDFDSTWLPTQSPISDIEAPGDWRYDLATMDFIAGSDDVNAAGLSWSMNALELDLEAQQLAGLQGSPTQVSEELISLPARLPDSVRDLAEEVTANVDSDFERAVALQQWFREDGGFTYDLDDAVEGNGVDELAAFLDPDIGRVGYCEQFAASMAVMARVLGIPARVAVGFLAPEPVAGQSGTYVYSAHDLHAWPELFFPGAGWVRFEPTPGGPDGRAQSIPDYTREGVSTGNPEQPTDTASPTQAPTDGANPDPRTAPSEEAAPEDQAGGGGAGDDGFPWITLLAWVFAVLLVASLALLPRLLRERRRTTRLQGGPEAAWAELRATLVDLGHAWPEGRSPREVQDHLERLFGWPEDPSPELRPRRGPDQCPEAVAALGRITDDLERMRYARDHAATSGRYADDVGTVSRALAAGVQPRTRRRAEWWPRSAFQLRAPETHEPDDASVQGRVVEHV